MVKGNLTSCGRSTWCSLVSFHFNSLSHFPSANRIRKRLCFTCVKLSFSNYFKKNIYIFFNKKKRVMAGFGQNLHDSFRQGAVDRFW